MNILSVFAREILDSRGNPTIEVDVRTKLGLFRGVSPSGASTGENEAVERRDGGKRYFGLGVRKTVSLINNKIAKQLVGKSCLNQKKLDELLCLIDGTVDKRKVGANGIVACSMAIAKAGAASSKLELYAYLNQIYSKIVGGNVTMKIPTAYFNVLNGGRHAANKLAFQEFMIVPSANSFSKRMMMASEIYHHLQKLLIKKFPNQVIAVGDEGGFAPQISKPEQAFDLLTLAVKKAGYQGKVKFAIDVAASEFYSEKKSRGKISGEYAFHKRYNSKSLLKYYLELCGKYPLVSVEDPFEQNAFSEFAELKTGILASNKLKKRKIQIVGDDLTCTNIERLKVAQLEGSINCLLLKVNQIGTLTEAMQAAAFAMENGWDVMVSHRSGESCDDFIADLSVALGCGQIKSGAPARGERVAKYNQLLRIEESLKRKVKG